MQIKSRLIIKQILTNETILYCLVHSTFLKIPAHVLNSNEKIVLLTFKQQSHLTSLQAAGQFDINHQAISDLTGVPLGTINRLMPQLIAKIPEVNKYMFENSAGESIRVETYKSFGTARVYSFTFTDPNIKYKTSVNIISDSIAEPETPQKQKNTSRGESAKMKILLETGFDESDLRQYLRWDIDRIKRSVKYFLHKQEFKKKTEQNLTTGYFSKTISCDYGKTFLEVKDKAVLYFNQIEAAANLIRAKFSEQQFKDILKQSYKFPPVSLTTFQTKSDLRQTFDYKFNRFDVESSTRAGIEKAVVNYFHEFKYLPEFNGKTEESTKEILRNAILQLFHTVIQTETINKNAA